MKEEADGSIRQFRAEHLRQQEQVIIMHPYQIAGLKALSDSLAKHSIGFHICVPAARVEFQLRSKGVKYRPERLSDGRRAFYDINANSNLRRCQSAQSWNRRGLVRTEKGISGSPHWTRFELSQPKCRSVGTRKTIVLEEFSINRRNSSSLDTQVGHVSNKAEADFNHNASARFVLLLEGITIGNRHGYCEPALVRLLGQ